MGFPFDTVLVANRGEIACRVIRTARRLGLRSVAVHSSVDARARHVLEADEAVALGGVTAAESYLRIDALVDAARRTGAGAIHPGYGFLSENPAFVDACTAAGIAFVGPSAEAMRAMGLKDAAKRLMAEAGVPVVPGYHGEEQTPERLAAEAGAVGYPVLIKARAGGGGKGMRRVESPDAFADALAAARREGEASFGDGAVLIEKYVASPRHVEVQVFGDAHGDVVHLFERDCSLQRRHQKVVEESPAPGITGEVREAMTAAAVRAARAIDYVGAGTIEFIADGSRGLRPDGFWFMEMNTRLQVEHPVTEAVTGVDLVEWQLRVAAGEPLPLAQDEIVLDGHAVEARLYAEDAAAGFLPATGRLERLRFGRGGSPGRSDGGPGLRVDSGVVEGDEVSPHYDPMLAKLIAHAPDRGAAFARLADLLANTVVLGTVTNRAFLLALCRHPDVLGARLDTSLIERELGALTAAPPPGERRAARAVVAVLRAARAPGAASGGDGARSLAARLGPWRLWGRPARRLGFEPESEGGVGPGGGADGAAGGAEDGVATVTVTRTGPAGWSVRDGEGELAVELDPDEAWRPGATIAVDGRRRALDVLPGADDASAVTLRLGEHAHRVAWSAPGAKAADAVGERTLVAPMPGRIIELGCAAGDAVVAGRVLVTLEAMKMEHALVAPAAGRVERVSVAVGDQVAQGDELLRLGEPEG